MMPYDPNNPYQQQQMPMPMPPPPAADNTRIIMGVAGLVVGFIAGLTVGRSMAPAAATTTTTAPTTTAAVVRPALRPTPSPAAPTAAPAAEEPDEPEPAPRAAPTQAGNPADRALSQRITTGDEAARTAGLCALETESDPAINFGLLDRDPGRFDGHTWVFRGKVIQVQNIPGGGAFLLISLNAYASQIVAVFSYAQPPDNVVANRRVRVYGRLAGTYSYQTIARQDRTVPKVIGLAVYHTDDVPRCPR